MGWCFRGEDVGPGVWKFGSARFKVDFLKFGFLEGDRPDVSCSEKRSGPDRNDCNCWPLDGGVEACQLVLATTSVLKPGHQSNPQSLEGMQP